VAITSDGDPSVRAAAIFAVSFHRPIAPLIGEALVRAASADPVEYVCSNALTLVRQNAAASPRIARTLERIAEHDAYGQTPPGSRSFHLRFRREG
jgi:hypothetical protein